MIKIKSIRPLKYDAIKPHLESVIELKIIDIKDFPSEQLTIVTIEDSIINEFGFKQLLAVRQKQFTFNELDQLENVLSSQVVNNGSYMDYRLNLLQKGLLYVTKNDPNPIYFSQSSDWEIYTEA